MTSIIFSSASLKNVHASRIPPRKPPNYSRTLNLNCVTPKIHTTNKYNTKRKKDGITEDGEGRTEPTGKRNE